MSFRTCPNQSPLPPDTLPANSAPNPALPPAASSLLAWLQAEVDLAYDLSPRCVCGARAEAS